MSVPPAALDEVSDPQKCNVCTHGLHHSNLLHPIKAQSCTSCSKEDQSVRCTKLSRGVGTSVVPVNNHAGLRGDPVHIYFMWQAWQLCEAWLPAGYRHQQEDPERHALFFCIL